MAIVVRRYTWIKGYESNFSTPDSTSRDATGSLTKLKRRIAPQKVGYRRFATLVFRPVGLADQVL